MTLRSSVVGILLLIVFLSSALGQRKAELDQDEVEGALMLKLAFRLVQKHEARKHYVLESDTISIEYGNIFDSSHKHLILHRSLSTGWGMVNVYLVQGKKFLKLYESNMYSGYTGDSVADFNGDGYKDYAERYYPSSGCCVRDAWSIYLYRPKTGRFSPLRGLINPVFDFKNKIVRGVEYGYDAPLYKLRWNEEHLDTLEYIYHDPKRHGHFLRSSRYYRSEYARGSKLSHVPEEYRHIGSPYEWFRMYANTKW